MGMPLPVRIVPVLRISLRWRWTTYCTTFLCAALHMPQRVLRAAYSFVAHSRVDACFAIWYTRGRWLGSPFLCVVGRTHALLTEQTPGYARLVQHAHLPACFHPSSVSLRSDVTFFTRVPFLFWIFYAASVARIGFGWVGWITCRALLLLPHGILRVRTFVPTFTAWLLCCAAAAHAAWRFAMHGIHFTLHCLHGCTVAAPQALLFSS